MAGCLPFLMASCADDNPLVKETNQNEQTHVLFAVDDFEPVDGSRTVTYLDGETYKVKWAQGDAVGIFPYEGYQQPFVIPDDQINQNFATFDGGYWSLKEGLTYNAYYPFSDQNFFAANGEGELNIPVSYDGQAQDGEAYSVGAYDYTYSDWQTAPETGGVTFNFHHIGSLAVVHLTYPATADFKSLALCTGSDELIPLKGTYDLTYNKDRTPEEGKTYVKIPFVADAESNSSALTLTLADCNGTLGETRTFYLMVPPMDLSTAATMSFRLTDSQDNVYDMEVTPTHFVSGSLYEFSIGLTTISDFAVSDYPFSSGWSTEDNLNADADATIGTSNVGKKAWADGDQIVVKKTETGMEEQTVTLAYDGTSWTSSGNITVFKSQDAALTASYAPAATAGMGEHLVGTCSITDGILSVSFGEDSRTYSRLRIASKATTVCTVTTTGFTPAGAITEATEAYTLTADAEGNAFLYGVFATSGTVTVKSGSTALATHTFTTATESGKSYALVAEPKVFSVSLDRQVIFSPGNLQYHVANKEWRFAEKQTDYVGTANSNISSTTYDGWIDLFGWGTGGEPTKIINNLLFYNSFTDWGINPIGSDAAGTWRTLTAKEWNHLFHNRQNKFALGTVDGVKGTILLPDNWTAPDGLTFTASTAKGLSWDATSSKFTNSNGDNFTHNTYTAEQWAKMEQAGAVFLPASGKRVVTNVSRVNEAGRYWSYQGEYSYNVLFDSSDLVPQYDAGTRLEGYAVRLVKDW